MLNWKCLVMVGVVAATAVGCDQGNERLVEKASIEGKAGAEAGIAAENENLRRRAEEMEKDLAIRHRFYQAVAGTYEGNLEDSKGNQMNARFNLAPSLPLYQSSRVRTLGEIESDLNNLYLNVQVVQWNASRTVASGCVFEKIRPDIGSGRIELVGSGCANSYSVRLSDSRGGTPAHALQISGDVSSELASAILRGDASSVEALVGIRQSGSRASTLGFSVKRVSGGSPAPEAPSSTVDEDTAYRVQEMEADLALRQAFFQAIKGTYEGTMQTEQGAISIRITLAPSLPPYAAGRTRTVEEIATDLANLYFNVQVVQWNPENMLSAVGCRVQGVRPDIVNGELQIAAEGCPNFYSLHLTNPASPEEKPGDIATAVRSGRIGGVMGIAGEVHPTTNASIYQFSASRRPNGGGQ